MFYYSVNGQPTNQLSITDRSIAYGDGIFTTANIVAGKIELLPKHIERLTQGCQQLGLPKPNFVQLTDEITAAAQNHQQAVLKIIITAGEGGRGYSRRGINSPNVIISISSFPRHYIDWQDKGISLGLSEQKLGINPMLLGLKHLNRLEQVLIRRELDQRNEDDILLLNINDEIIETSCANIFWFLDEQLYTPDIKDSGVAGLMRALILEHIPCKLITKARLSDFYHASEVFICNSVMGIMPVRQFQDKTFSIEKVKILQSAIQTRLNKN